MHIQIFNHALITIVIGSLFPVIAHAESADIEARIKQLEQLVQKITQQRIAQDKQIEILTKELVGIARETQPAKITHAEEKSSTAGAPVYANFKNGVTLQDAGSHWKLAINGRIQADYRQFSPDAVVADTFSLRRARLGASLTFYQDYVARIEGEYANGSAILTYGYLDINKFNGAKLRLGQFKPNYGLERAMSTNFNDFQERSIADSLLGSTFDRGVMVFGNPATGLNYSIAYINGTGTQDENNAKYDGKDLTGRATVNLAEIFNWQDAVVHVGGFYANGEQGASHQANFIPTDQSEARGTQFFSTTCSAAACGTSTANGLKDNVKRTRSGYEAALAYGSAKLQGEFINTHFDGETYNRDIHAWYASALWNVTGEAFSGMYKDGVFGRMQPINNFATSGEGWGALQAGIRYSKFDASDFTTANAAGTGVLLNNPTGAADGLLVATNQANAWTLGVNWILNPNVRIITNLVRTNYGTPIIVRANAINKSLDKEEAITMRAQFDF